jgi:hypothetical protein
MSRIRRNVHAVRIMPRLTCLAAVTAIFGSLVIAAPVAAQPFDLPWISDRTLHIVAHLVVWTVIGLLLAMGLGRWWWLAWPIGLVLAAAEELHQGLVPGRTVDLFDWVLNAVGVTVAVAVVWAARNLFARRPLDPAAAARDRGHLFARVSHRVMPHAPESSV